MKRKMIGAAAAYMSGLFFASFFTGGSDLLLLAGLFPMFFAAAVKLRLKITDIIIVSVFFLAAVSVNLLYTNNVYNKITAYNNTEGSYLGKVKEIEFLDNDKSLITLSGRINNTCNADVTFFADSVELSYGDIITLNGCKFEVPENDYLFETANYYKSKGIFITISDAEEIYVDYTDSCKLQQIISEYRESVISDFLIKMGTEEGSFLSGIVFGETENIDDSAKTLMYRCGIGHVMAVSGLHISIIAALLMNILSKFGVNKYLSFSVLTIFLILMIIMVKYPVSAIRAAIMLLIMYSAKLFLRQNDTFNSLSVAALLICIFNPYAILDRGFLLSIAGTFGIGVFGPYMTANMKKETLRQRIAVNFVTMLCVMLAVFPLNILFFDETSIISPLANMIIVPLCTAALVIGVMYVLSGGIVSLLSIAKIITQLVLNISDLLGNNDFIHISCNNERLLAVLAICTIFVIIAHIILRKRRITALTLAVSMMIFSVCTYVSEKIENKNFRVAVLGRGTNAAVVVSQNGNTEIYDLSGNYKSADYVKRYLTVNGISDVNLLMLSDNVHSQYSSYKHTLELCMPDKFLISSDVPVSISDNNITYFNGNAVNIQNESYSAKFEADTLIIEYCGKTVVFCRAKDNIFVDGCLNVYYGNITKDTIPICNGNTIYLDEIENIMYENSDMNNFELIMINGDDDIRIRRLENGSC